MSDLADWLDARLGFRGVWRRHMTEYYVPKQLNWLYVFGFLALLVLCNQLMTGIWLVMFYTPSAHDAFSSIQALLRDVPYGWLLRTLHATGANALFVILYMHVLRGLLYGSYQRPRELVWMLGLCLFYLLMAESCCGYVLPWGQLSYWGAQVMTSLVSAVPYVGNALLEWVRGDYSVSDVTLHRFFAFHVVVTPLLLTFLVWLHLVALRRVGSNNPHGIEVTGDDTIPFHPYYTLKDAVGALSFLLIFLSVVFFFPEGGGLDGLNAEPANPLVTPIDITPAWYVAPFYAMLRAVPNKLLGIVVIAAALLIALGLPWLDKSTVRSMRYKGSYSRVALVLLVVSVVGLGYLGTHALTWWRLWLARGLTGLYFSYFIGMPWYTRYEMVKPIPCRLP